MSGEEVFCRTVIGGPLLSYKGLALPGVKIFADAVSDTDLAFVAFALKEGVDAFGVSFAETADDIRKVKGFAQKDGQSAYVIAKIERPEESTGAKVVGKFFLTTRKQDAKKASVHLTREFESLHRIRDCGLSWGVN